MTLLSGCERVWIMSTANVMNYTHELEGNWLHTSLHLGTSWLQAITKRRRVLGKLGFFLFADFVV